MAESRSQKTELVAVDLSSGAQTVLTSGYDFYSTPRLSPDGMRLAWLAWHHPNMPWDESELWVAEFDARGGLANQRKLAGGNDESIVQPEWAPDGSIVFVSDRSGWWNLYRLNPNDDRAEATALAPMKAEFAGPQWVFGMCWYGIDADGTIYASGGGEDGDGGGIWVISSSAAAHLLDIPDVRVESLQVHDGKLLYIGGSWAEPRRVVGLRPREPRAPCPARSVRSRNRRGLPRRATGDRVPDQCWAAGFRAVLRTDQP